MAAVVALDAESRSLEGVVSEVGLRRDEEMFNSFNLTIAMVLKSEGALTYDQGERLMREYRKELLGKKVEITAVVFHCPVCGRGFNTEQGMRQHARMVHEGKGRASKPKEGKKTRSTRRKTAGKKTSRKTGKRK